MNLGFDNGRQKLQKPKIMGLFTGLMNEQKYNNIMSIKTTKCSIKNNNTASNLFTSIKISRRQKHSPSSVFIILRTLRYKKQDRVDNGDMV